MRLISHRGNISGPNSKWENHPDYIDSALSSGFQVEIDVWKTDSDLYLGHDEPQYLIDKDFLKARINLWCHAKNIEALAWMLRERLHCFWHQADDLTLTSQGYLWVYPGKPLTNSDRALSVAVMPELVKEWDVSQAWGICTDYIGKYGNA